MLKQLVLAQLPKAPAYLLSHFTALLLGMAAAYVSCLVLFGPNSFIGNIVDAAAAAAVAYGAYRVGDAATHAALRRLRIEAPASAAAAGGATASGVPAGGNAAAAGGAGMPDLSALSALMGGGGGGAGGAPGGFPDVAKMMADPAFMKMASQMMGGAGPRGAQLKKRE